MSISALIKKGWEIYSINFQKFLVPIGIMLIPYILYFLFLIFGGPELILLMLILNALMVVINLWIGIVIIIMLDKLYKNQPIDLNKIYEIAFKKIPSYFLVAILTALVIIGGLILLIIPGIIFIVWYGFANYAVILEEKDNKGIAALKFSKNLVQGRWGATFWRLLLPALALYLVVLIVIFIVSYIITGGNFNLESYNQSLIINAISSLITLILTPLFVSFSLILYNNLKETKEQARTETPAQI
ncbi:MAG: hypothetical protein A2Y82_00390 [Candidatus Buchananbacteria bacterium RBG_13_36_9]|uniref:Glycerophosphoryl diester phosphodiesterase membrane domain-containing protein n=1 Tax=Candidatus Buchananbacteria bacterium RBG_13_36_9 TaxID=1797530 RepID=A0A1G1XQC6_9BACT|nr:MAG: hypothetical protein A2Y82_00390 [Candidatus Buchananbacteria bacterium RBG_13_36_9]